MSDTNMAGGGVSDTTRGTADPPADPAAAPETHRARRDPARVVRVALLAALVLALVSPPFLVGNQWLTVGGYVMVGAVGAIGLTLLTGQAGQLSLGTPFFLFAGGVGYCVISGEGESSSGAYDYVGFGLPPILGLVGAVLLSSALGYVFAPVAARVRGVYLGVATLALVYLAQYIGRQYTSIAGSTGSGRAPGEFEVFGFSMVSNDPELTILGQEMGENQREWYLFLILTVLAYLLARGAVRSRPGRSWRAVRDNEHAAAALGVPVQRVRAEVFAISSGFAGLAGVMLILWFDLLKPDENPFNGSYGVVVAIAFLAMVLIGGLGSVGGAIAGAALVFGLPQAIPLWVGGATGMFGTAGPDAITPIIFTAFVYGAAVVAVVLFEPGGLAALARRAVAALDRAPFGHLLTPSKGS